MRIEKYAFELLKTSSYELTTSNLSTVYIVYIDTNGFSPNVYVHLHLYNYNSDVVG